MTATPQVCARAQTPGSRAVAEAARWCLTSNENATTISAITVAAA
eukprot:CAMPEP_0179371274 /NCGR_PEP_ID=MMETSP0797-20121207/85636_1 /TAXON_ID=47934 /ORGANISM="Dinophysis acuminata, Strain DAEP01" /LENGTH=44 /DNA_ID= /DNA_START= /DNA_END= /DNA_ORIENTATION=